MEEARSLTYSINVETNAAQAESDLRNLVSSIGDAGEIRVNADTSQAEADIEDLVSGLGESEEIQIDADTSQSEAEIKKLHGSLGALGIGADSIGEAFRSSFLRGIDSGDRFASSLKSGIGGAMSYVGGQVTEFKDKFLQGAENIKNGFTHPVETIKNGFGNAIQGAKDKLIDMAREAEKARDIVDDLGGSSGGTGKDVDGLGNSSEEAEEKVKDLGNAADSSGSKFEKFGGVLKGIGAGILAATTAATTAVGAFAASSVNAGMAFDSSMSQVAATMGYSVSELNDPASEAAQTFDTLRGFAMEMGSSTAFSASQAADALNYMALAGYDADTSMAMLPNVLNLAAAGGIELADASDMVTDAQSALGLTLDETAQMVDKMAMASSKSNTSVAQLGEAFLTVGGTAKNLAGGTTELSTALGILADNGVKGSEGGTALRNVILSLSAPTDTAAEALTKLGIQAFDADGNMRPLNETFADLNGALSSLTQEEQSQALSKIFNKADLKSVNALLATDADRWEELGGYIDDAAGSAANMAETQLDNLAGDITMFKSALEGAQILISDGLSPDLRQFVKFGTEGISTLSEAFKEGGLSGAMGALGNVLGDGLSMVIGMLPAMIDAGMQLLGALGKGILDNLPVILDAAMQIVGSLGKGILGSLPMLIGAAAQIIGTLASGIGSALPELIPSVTETIFLVASTLLDNLPLILDAGMQILSGFAEGILGALPILVEQLPEIILQMVGFFSENLPTILEQGSQMLLSLGMGIITAIPQLVAQLPEIITSVVGFVTENLPLIAETGVNLLVQLGAGIIQAIPQLVESLPQIISAVTDGLSQLPGMMLDIGKNIVEGVWNGISQMGSWIKEKVSGFFGGIVDGVKGLLGIHSPSTVFAGIGDNMAAGLGKGFEAAIGGVTKDIENSIPTELDMPTLNAPDVSYGVKPVVGSPVLPVVPDVPYDIVPTGENMNDPYGATPVIGNFSPPDVSDTDDGDPGKDRPSPVPGPDPEPLPSGESGGLRPFAPHVTIVVQGNASKEVIDELEARFSSRIKELWEECQEEELERQALKNQFAF